MSIKKVGRNDPCPCGSGKKYKHCCYPDKTKSWKTAELHASPSFIVIPQETPEPINHHIESTDGGKTWKQKPGLLAAVLVGTALTNIDEEIDEVFKRIRSKLKANNLEEQCHQEITNCLHEVEHKLYSVKYHLNNYQRFEKDKENELLKSHKPPSGIQIELKEPSLLFEMEALLFQTKSCLDILSWILKPTFGFSHCDFGNQGDDIITKLSNNCPQALKKKAANIISLIEAAQRTWIVELVKMRDVITHYSRLKGFFCFIADPYSGSGKINIHYPTMPNSERAFTYCENIWKYLVQFCENFIDHSIDETSS
jgi:hypothetical protein